MSDTERAPLTGAAMDEWMPPPADPRDRAIAAVAAGLGAAVITDDPAQGFLAWSPPDPLHVTDPQATDPAVIARLGIGWDPDQPARSMAPPPRLVVTGSVLPTEVVPRLLACAAIGSAVLPVTRPPGALRRRPWSWPLRIGIAEDELVAAFADLRASGIVPESLISVTDVRSTPGAVDVLVLRATPADAATFVTARRQVANAVICVADSLSSWPIDDAQFALVRAASASVLTALAPASNATDPAIALSAHDIAERMLLMLRYFSHAHPLDVALTAAFGRSILIAAEIDAIAPLTLPGLLRSHAEQARADAGVLTRMSRLPMMPLPVPPAMAEPPPPPPPPVPAPEPPPLSGAEPPEPLEMAGPPEPDAAFDSGAVESAADELAELADGSFDHESGEASRALEVQARLDAELDEAAASPRYLQAYVGAKTAGNILQAGPNTLSVFIGDIERAALIGNIVPQGVLFDDPALTTARVTIVLAPLVPLGEAVRAELDVPRVGRSIDVPLEWTLPASGVVQARLLMIHRNRVLQTLRITGEVGAPAEVTERIVLWDQIGRLDERQPFDGTIVLNHDAKGESKVVAHADGATTIGTFAEIDAVARRLRRRLLGATQLTSKADDPARTKILIDVAASGSELFTLLNGFLRPFVNAQRIQIVTARSGFFLPLELVYHRPPPNLDAALCPNWSAGKQCGAHCFDGDDDASIVCPSVFWGMSRFFERQVVELDDENGDGFTVQVVPARKAERRAFDTALVAASSKVTDAAVRGVLKTLGVPRVRTWADWVAEIGKSPRDLLLLMPHTDDEDATMEISGSPLERVRILKSYVTGPAADSHPTVVLFGCDTAGSEEDPAGFANWFMNLGASFVFSTLTMLLAKHAASMSDTLTVMLRDAHRPQQSLGEFVAGFRREAVRGGLISALAVTAYGDADWSL